MYTLSYVYIEAKRLDELLLLLLARSLSSTRSPRDGNVMNDSAASCLCCVAANGLGA